MPTPRLSGFLLSALFLFLISSLSHAADSVHVSASSLAAAAATDSSASPSAGPSSDAVDSFVMPPNAEIAYQEYVKNNDRIDVLQRDNDKQLAKLGNETEVFELNRKKLETNLRLLSAVAGKCGTTPKDEELRRQQAEEIRGAMKAIKLIVIRGDSPDYLPKFDADLKLLCQTPGELTLLRADLVKDYLEQLDAMRTKWVQGAQADVEKRNKEKSVRERLRTQLAGAMEKLKTQNERTSNFSDLKWLVLILGVLSVMVMLIVRTFPVELQTEWVASGQVIQFMTVLIILIAILSLGINGILKEETLGTLLGGIGGYVLAQGVGRAALRNALSGTAVPPPTTTTTTAIFPPTQSTPSMSSVQVAVQPPSSTSTKSP